jgi:hypothetical protein
MIYHLSSFANGDSTLLKGKNSQRAEITGRKQTTKDTKQKTYNVCKQKEGEYGLQRRERRIIHNANDEAAEIN